MYSFVFEASIRLYTHCISEMTVAMFLFKYYHVIFYIKFSGLSVHYCARNIRRIFREVRSSENKMY